MAELPRSAIDRLIIGCLTLAASAVMLGFGIIVVGWLFGIGLRLSGL